MAEKHGIVKLHVLPRFGGVINVSPPCMKLETYLRMAKIPYECDFSFKKSAKGKFPWIEYNGKSLADSNFCIEFLNKEFGVDLDDHLSDEQKGIARSVLVMLEENTYWTLVHYRWFSEYASEVRDKAFSNLPLPIRIPVFWSYKRTLKNELHGHGIGRHTPEEIYSLAEKDLRAVSAILGEKWFLFGDQPCLADAALFALVCNIIDTAPKSEQGKLILNELKNLENHTKHMEDAFYPDLDDVIAGKTSKT